MTTPEWSSRSDFERLAREAFAFLINDYGYAFAGGNRRRARWHSRKVDVTVHFDERSRELEVLLRPRALTRAGVLRVLKGDGGTPLSLADVAAWRRARAVLERLPAIVDQPELLAQRLGELAGALRDMGDPLLRAESQEFLAADRHVAEHAGRMTREFGRR
jgi:hypothetical protein